MRDILQEIRQALRSLGRAPAFTATAIAILGFGIGANTAVFSVVRAVLLRPLPFRDAGQVVSVYLKTRDSDRYPLSIPELLLYREENRSLTGLAAVAGMSANLTGSGDAERLSGLRATGNLFTLLGVEAEIGRTLLPEDDRAGARVVVLTHGLWVRRFGGEPGVIGRSLTLNGDAYEVVGVLPPRFRFQAPLAELAVPLAPERDPARLDRRAAGMLRCVGRLRPGVTAAQAAAEMSVIARRLQKEFPDSSGGKQAVTVMPYLDEAVGGVRRALFILHGAVACVLLIACANLAGLTLVRAAGRGRETAVRAALGATRARLARGFLTESLLLAGAGGLLGSLVAVWSVQGLSGLAPKVLPRAHEIAVDGTVLAYTTALVLLAGVACGAWPALLASRAGLNDALKGSGRRGGGALGRTARSRARRLLVAAEIALAMLLLAGAGLFLRSFARLMQVDPGFDARQVLMARLALPKGRYGPPEAMVQFHDRLKARLEALPGVESAGVISIAPMSGPLGTADFWRDDRPPADPQNVEAAHYRVISPSYLRTVRIRMLRGREFAATDDARVEPVVIVSQTLVAHLFGDEDPIGRRLTLDDRPQGPRRLEIVGVAADVRHEALDAEPVPDVYLPMAQIVPEVTTWLANNQFWAVRASGDPQTLTHAVQACVRDIDPEVAASSIRRFEAYLDDAVGLPRLVLHLVGLFAVAALILAALGLYGLVAFSVSQRRREIGIRVALGAGLGDVQRLVAGEGIRLALLGLVAGGVAAFVFTRLLAGLLFGVGPHDPATFAVVAATLAAVAILASWIPARAAGRIAVLEALRAE